jgi:hypothetical protein
MLNRKLLLLCASIFFITSTAFAATKSYQVTGPIVESNDKMIVVQKGKDRWELQRTPDTKVNANLKPGEKVTISYSMTANDVEAKETKTAKATKKAK